MFRSKKYDYSCVESHLNAEEINQYNRPIPTSFSSTPFIGNWRDIVTPAPYQQVYFIFFNKSFWFETDDSIFTT